MPTPRDLATTTTDVHTVTDVCYRPACPCLCVVHTRLGQSHINQSINDELDHFTPCACARGDNCFWSPARISQKGTQLLYFALNTSLKCY